MAEPGQTALRALLCANAAAVSGVLSIVMSPPRWLRAVPASLPDRSDDELMTLAQAGVRDAFAALVLRHAERIVHACSRFVGDREAGAELAQETWVIVWVKRAQYRPEGRFTLWLLTAARNRCRNHLRRHGMVRRYDLRAAEEPHEPPSPDQIDQLLIEEKRRRVRDALAKLPERVREALLMRYAEDLRYDEMADVLSANEATLRSRVHDGLHALRRVLEKSR